MKRVYLFAACCLISFAAFSQSPVDVVETTFKVNALGGEETFYYGFAEGDDIIFTLIETNGKDLKEVEIIEWPSSLKFSERKTARIENKTIHVNRTAIFKFRFQNSSLAGRYCKLKIQRRPAGSATQNFNTTVYWKTISDTTYYNEEEKYIVKTDSIGVPFFSQVVKVPARNVQSAINRQLLALQLPENTKAWGLYIGVGDQGKESYYEGREHFLNRMPCKDSVFKGYGALAATALGEADLFPSSRAKERISYWLIGDQKNALAFQEEKPFAKYKEGYIGNSAMRLEIPLTGTTYIGLANDSGNELEVIVKAVAVTVVNVYNTRTVRKMKINNREEPFLKN